jgi:hypothetical protein
MMVLGKTGVCMALLLLLLFVTRRADTMRSVGRSGGGLLSCFSCSISCGHIISALLETQSVRLCSLELVTATAGCNELRVNLTVQNWGGTK